MTIPNSLSLLPRTKSVCECPVYLAHARAFVFPWKQIDNCMSLTEVSKASAPPPEPCFHHFTGMEREGLFL